MNTCKKKWGPSGARKSLPLPRKGYPQDALFAASKVELLRVNKDVGYPVRFSAHRTFHVLPTTSGKSS
jgi:hypothetical protein